MSYDRKPYNPDTAIAKISDPLVRAVAEEVRVLGYREMMDTATRIATALRAKGLAT